ncbi:hypothetical protein ACJIZ3_013230 [Penstemon smallii]|uniref:Tropomyosin n=1 Tax=Penstemon smallii TaxID=265156 RepID=A0ABD3US66_9LAMI
MATSLIVLPATLVYLFVSFPQSNALDSSIDCQTPSCFSQGNHDSFAFELEEAKLRIARLESILEERTEDVNRRNQYMRECEKKIEELSIEIDRLKAAFSTLGDDYSLANQKLIVLEEEVRQLWAASRKNNFEIHALEFKALEAETKLEQVTSQVGEMANIVSEQWIQIQQLEQAVHMAEVRMSKIKREFWRRCPFVKGILDLYVPRDGSVLNLCKSRVLQIFSAIHHYHHQLQGFIKHAMKSNELTAALAHSEVVFFVASAVVAFPIMTVCMLLLSQLS